ncbi:MAG: carbohydrate ABC transporter permease [Chloroflexota bacterium]|nr:carbohydrate ABC transporter permease [Chloroflexota bacterium]
MFERIFKSKSVLSMSPIEMTLSYILLIGWAIVCLFPIYWLAVTSLKLPIDVNMGPYYVPFVDFEPSGHAWEYILAGDLARDTRRNYANTVVVASVSAVIALILGTAAAYALTRFDYNPKLGAIGLFILCLALGIILVVIGVPWLLALVLIIALFIILLQTIGKRFKRSLGNSDIAFWLISQRMLPPVAVVIPIYIMFQFLGNAIGVRLLDTRFALIITYIAVNLPIVIWLMRDYFLTIPIELEECAAIDGASRYRTFVSIVLPLSLPGLVATFLFILVFAWNEYLLALFLSGAKSQTLPLTVAAQNATRGPQWWYMSVLILIMIIPVILIAIALERFIARGLLVGAVKG